MRKLYFVLCCLVCAGNAMAAKVVLVCEFVSADEGVINYANSSSFEYDPAMKNRDESGDAITNNDTEFSMMYVPSTGLASNTRVARFTLDKYTGILTKRMWSTWSADALEMMNHRQALSWKQFDELVSHAGRDWSLRYKCRKGQKMFE